LSSVRREALCSLVLLALSAGYWAGASRIGDTALADAVGPAGLPRVYAIALAAIGVAIGLSAFVEWRLRGVAAPAAESTGAARRLLRGAGTVAIGAIYLAIVPLIGYPFAIALTIAAMAVFQGERLSWRVALVAVAGAAALYGFFDLVLGVSLPAPWKT
jgi:putative tricarboxylic transport membrane protein